ncbi:MAG: dihydrolipoamide acetyltransferase family protein [Planctomycetota bacterium]
MARIPVVMPQFGEAVAEATIRSWLIAPGDGVAQDQVIAEVETEKAVLELSAPVAGTCAELVAQEGDTKEVGEVVAWFEGLGTEIEQPAPATRPPPGRDRADERPDTGRTATGPITPAGGSRSLPPSRGEGLFRSPRLRDLMAEHGLTPADLQQVRGTGSGGRVRSRDLEHFLAELAEQYEARPVTRLRRFVGDTMRRSWQRPLATIAARVRMDPILTHRRRIDGRPSASVYALRALGLALADMPEAAQLVIGDQHWVPKHIDLGLAVEVEDGVLTPVVRGVDGLGLAALAGQVDQLMERAKERRLGPDDTRNGIATVSNYGSLGIIWATPVPVGGQSLIFGIGAVQRVPDWNPRTNTWDCVRASEVTLSFDHRIIDGAGSSRLLTSIVRRMEHPDQME